MGWHQQQANEEERRYLEEQALEKEETEQDDLSGHDAICDCGDESSHDLLKNDPAYEGWVEEVEGIKEAQP